MDLVTQPIATERVKKHSLGFPLKLKFFSYALRKVLIIFKSDIRLAAPETPAVHDLVYEYFVDGKQYFGYKFNFSNPNLWISGETLGFRFDYTPLIQVTL